MNNSNSNEESTQRPFSHFEYGVTSSKKPSNLQRGNIVLDYYNQRDDFNPYTQKSEPSSHCMSECFSCVIDGVLSLFSTTERFTEHTYNTIIRAKNKSMKENWDGTGQENFLYYSGVHAKLANELLQKIGDGSFSLERLDMTYDELCLWYSYNKTPVIVGSNNTLKGHIIVYNYTWLDPYGIPSSKITDGGTIYTRFQNDDGYFQYFSDDYCKNMIFRQLSRKGGWITNSRNVCWVLRRKSGVEALDM